MGRVHRYPLAKLTRDLGVRFVRGALDRVDADERLVTTVEGEPLGFEALLVATGAKAEVALERALTWWPEGDPDAFGGLLRDLEQGYVRKVAFVVPPQVAWPLPAYELALMTAREVRSMGIDDAELTIVTPEDAPLGIFGKQAAEAVAAELAAAGVGIVTGAYVQGHTGGQLEIQPGARRVEVENVVALPVRPARASLGFPPTMPGSSRPTSTVAWSASSACGRRATEPTSRSSRAAWPHSRPTLPPRASRRLPARASPRSRSAPSCGAC